MASATAVAAADSSGPLSNPRPALIAGLALAGAAFLWARVAPHAVPGGRVLLVFAAAVAGGAAVAIRPGRPLTWAGAALVAFLDAWGLYAGADAAGEWDSIRLVFAVAAPVALLGALVAALPRFWRKLVLSGAVVLHFGGILSAVLSASPTMWAAGFAYGYLYRPYLEFMYLTNAYHFYAPDPGPSYIFWFDIEYTTKDDAKTHWHWVKAPNLDDDGWPEYPLALQYQRRLALANLASGIRPAQPGELEQAAIARARENRKRFLRHQPIIPRNPDPDFRFAHYGPPTPSNKVVVASYVHHVAHEFAQRHPGTTVTGVRLYRVEHMFLSAGEFAKGFSPQVPYSYMPYFWGEYDAEGNLKPEQDGFLYWHLPFLRVNPDMLDVLKNNEFPAPPPETHAGQRPLNLDLEEENRKLLVWQDQVDRVVLQCMQHPPNPKPEFFAYVGYVYLHAGYPKWVRHPGETVWKEK